MKSTRAIRIITSLSLGVVAIASLSWVGLGTLTGNIDRIDVFGSLKNRPEANKESLNFLVVGSDSREGLSRKVLKELRVGTVDTAAGGRSDTMFLVHISKKRDSAYMVSIPRDSLATIPEHLSVDGTFQVDARPGKINAAFAFGGAPLLIQTIEEETNLKIDHYVEVNFAGFTGMVDALGGIEVCTKVDINDPKSHLKLAAGTHTLNGIESLKYVRTRDFDRRGDIGRMARQQQFASSVLRKATSGGVLFNPIKLVNFFNATTSAIKFDSALDQRALITLAKQMRSVSSGNIRTLTVPLSNTNANVAGVGSVVIWDEEKSADLWNRMKNDLPVVDLVKSTKKAPATLNDTFKTYTAADNPCGAIK